MVGGYFVSYFCNVKLHKYVQYRSMDFCRDIFNRIYCYTYFQLPKGFKAEPYIFQERDLDIGRLYCFYPFDISPKITSEKLKKPPRRSESGLVNIF